MISLLVQPTMHLIRKHLALAGLNLDKSVIIESPGLEAEPYLDKMISGKNTLGLLYERGKLRKSAMSSKPLIVHIERMAPDGKVTHQKRKVITCVIPFKISIISNQLLDLDNYELLHTMELANTSFAFKIIIPELVEAGAEYLEYVMQYVNLTHSSNEKLDIKSIGKGFQQYTFAVDVEGYLIAPYTDQVEITTKVAFEMHLGNKETGQLAFTKVIPET